MKNAITLYDIVDRAKWKEFQDHFADVLGLTLTTVDKRMKLIAEVSTPSSLRQEIKQTLASIAIKEKECFASYDLGVIEKKWRDGIKSPAGFYYFLIPMKVAEKTFAYVLVGPVVIGKSLAQALSKEHAKSLSLDAKIFTEALQVLKSFTFYEITSTIDMIYDVASYTLELEYQNKALRKVTPQPSAILNKLYGWYADKLLVVLLDIALDIAHAERGSLMLLDEERSELYIKEARGIDPKIIEKTRVKLGEGIAGIVAREGKSLIIDETLRDQRIQSRLHQPKLTSAIAMPFTIDNRIKGVLNISTTQHTHDKFSSEGIDGIDKLIKLVEMTIGDLSRLASSQ